MEHMGMNELVITTDGGDFLLVKITDEDDYSYPSGIEIFDVFSKQLSIVTKLLNDILNSINERDSGFLFIDDMYYDGRGVELSEQFGYMTTGSITNMSELDASVSPIKVCCDIDANVTILCDMDYSYPKRGEKKRERATRKLRIGSGKGADEAFANARKRINALLDDIHEIEEWLFDKFYISNVNLDKFSSLSEME